jgi:hypothetical protein
MKNLFALFSAKKVKVKIEDFNFDLLEKNYLSKIRGGGQPANRTDINILISD